MSEPMVFLFPTIIYHGQLFSIANGNTVKFFFSHITFVAHEHDGNIFVRDILESRALER